MLPDCILLRNRSPARSMRTGPDYLLSQGNAGITFYLKLVFILLQCNIDIICAQYSHHTWLANHQLNILSLLHFLNICKIN